MNCAQRERETVKDKSSKLEFHRRICLWRFSGSTPCRRWLSEPVEALPGLGFEQKDVVLITLPPLLRPVLSPAKETALRRMSERERQGDGRR